MRLGTGMYHPEEADIGLPMDLPQKTDGTEAAELRTQVLEFLPALRAFARSLTRNRTEADDLVQETLLKALSNIDKFDPGTNLRAWLFTILRNTYYTEIRKRRRENDGMSTLAQQDTNMGPAQEWAVTLKTLKSALEELPSDQREALILVGAAGLSYEEAAEVCGCALGTIKSRVNRARAKLLVLMGADATADVVETDALALSAARS
ncbi:RNA polymerase sigma-E factor (sigma-24) protein [Azorhizobium caulinodans ORS 571]|uniref:RNA polymerase sigma factor n=2 Tax=Xanthobacteraceae TaxID=335928 RepID=A8HSG5_AZOC5|nr:RNA polymerase sigma-E factor (sigma-24) protein [Azorhizobium caulinodans ORS 571]